jgi:hypothetical protein
MPPVAVHFNGGVNLPDADAVLRELVGRVPDGVRRLPDGETGDRAGWIAFQLPRLLATPGLERVDPSPDAAGRYAGGRPSLRLAAGADPDTLVWPDLGYAAAYQASYATFCALRDEGIVPAGVRFQAEYPTPHAVCGFVDIEDRARVEPSYERALLADLDVLLAAVPHAELAVQWDVAVEIGEAERSGGQAIADIAEAIARYADHVPDDVPVGMHLCYGDFGHEHFLQPPSLAIQVALADAVTGRTRRPPAWISFTVPQDRGDEAYFAPLADLHPDPATELYFALVPYHPDRQPMGTTDAQVALVDRLLPADAGPWGICTECSLGRAERAEVPNLLDLHREILARYAPMSTA